MSARNSDRTVLIPLDTAEGRTGTGARRRGVVAGVTALALAVAGAGAGALAWSASGSAPDAVTAAAEAESSNVALIGTPEASYTASWNRIDAVNDGAGVSSGGGHDAVWATWSGDRPATQWLEYSWPAPVTVDRSVIRFWSDGTDANGDNVRVPASWTIQYWDADAEAFVDLPDPSGYPTERLELNETTFEPVTTTRLRATFDALQGSESTSYSGVGVSEWEVWGTGGVEEPDPVDPNGPIDYSPVHIPTDVGVLPDLPADIDAIFTDGRVETVEVDWDDVTADDVAEAGSFDVAGTSPDLVEPVGATVHVRDGEPGEIAAVDYVSVVTLAGVAPVLPGTVVAEYEDGSMDSRIPVTWDDVDPADYAEPDGLFFVAGDVEGTDIDAEATVFVVEPDDGPDTTAPTVTVSAEPGPATSGWYVQHPTVTVTAIDNRDNAPAVEVSVDDGEWAAYDGPFAIAEDGEHTVSVRATDADGNVGEGSRDLRVDATAPVTTATVRDLGTSVEITLESTDAGSGVDKIQWEGPGTFWGTYTEPFTRALTDEEQVIEFAATDAAGNEEERQQVVLPALGGGDPELDLAVEVSPRCLAGKAYVAVRATNGEDVPVDVTLSTPLGEKSFDGVAPGKNAYQSFAARATSVPAGSVTVTGVATVDGGEVTSSTDVAFDTLDCS
ncbi:Ig-like domain-containing protein [Cellulosimicrobium arenosum]|uniref:Ig-like domain-containing protein n=1 Tax=Cellulosimicrobium arenosum TaxID=2708133 RepID=A0A927PEW7_9MICO|nr:Ig-like domain-containing protein [Cellulosimicrobium arenosum]MBD8080026.1 Ig-like domain-containing protein [Cellulosimicrobium arenosum]